MIDSLTDVTNFRFLIDSDFEYSTTAQHMLPWLYLISSVFQAKNSLKMIEDSSDLIFEVDKPMAFT